jgi:hypothetical protein
MSAIVSIGHIGSPGFPQHPEREELIAWLGGKYDPEKFEAATVKFANPKTRWNSWQG